MSSSSPAARFPVLPLRGDKDRATADSLAQDTVAPNAVPSDESLLSEICTGNREALAVLFERYARLTRGVALRILRDVAEAEDLVQDLFLFIQRKCQIFDSSKSTARSWIVQMTYHRAIERRRYLMTRQFYARGNPQKAVEQVVGVATTEYDYSAEAVFGRNGLQKVMEALSNDQRETLHLHFLEGYSLAEISEKLGQPHGNIRHHYYRGLAQLRKQMSGSNVRIVERYGK
jgi:RNA polymerase sigma-70 factor, ECF subfamily